MQKVLRLPPNHYRFQNSMLYMYMVSLRDFANSLQHHPTDLSPITVHHPTDLPPITVLTLGFFKNYYHYFSQIHRQLPGTLIGHSLLYVHVSVIYLCKLCRIAFTAAKCSFCLLLCLRRHTIPKLYL